MELIVYLCNCISSPSLILLASGLYALSLLGSPGHSGVDKVISQPGVDKEISHHVFY